MIIFATIHLHQKKLIEQLALPLPHSKASLTVALQRGHRCSLVKNKVGESLERENKDAQINFHSLRCWRKCMNLCIQEWRHWLQNRWLQASLQGELNVSWKPSTDHIKFNGKRRNPGRKKTSSDTGVTWQTGQVPAATASSTEAAVPHSSPLTCTWLHMHLPLTSTSACFILSHSPKPLSVLSKSSSSLPFWQTGKRRQL